MRIKLRQDAEPGTLFTKEALSGQVGASVPVRLGALGVEGTIVEAAVVHDGRAVEVTVDVAEDERARLLEISLAPTLDRYSVGLSVGLKP